MPPALHVPKATSAPKLVHRHVTSAHQEISLRRLPARGVKVVLMANTRRLLQLGIAQIVPQGPILHQKQAVHQVQLSVHNANKENIKFSLGNQCASIAKQEDTTKGLVLRHPHCVRLATILILMLLIVRPHVQVVSLRAHLDYLNVVIAQLAQSRAYHKVHLHASTVQLATSQKQQHQCALHVQ